MSVVCYNCSEFELNICNDLIKLTVVCPVIAFVFLHRCSIDKSKLDGVRGWGEASKLEQELEYILRDAEDASLKLHLAHTEQDAASRPKRVSIADVFFTVTGGETLVMLLISRL